LYDQPVYQYTANLDGKTQERAIEGFQSVAETFEGLEMSVTAALVRHAVQDLVETSLRKNYQWLKDQIKTIERVSHQELSGKAFFHVRPEDAKYFPTNNEPYLFGEAVADVFPSANFDIHEAGTCLALGRMSASVFHLMRALEVGLAALGAKFNISLANTNWAPAISQIERAIREMHTDPVWKELPDCKEQQAYFAQAASHFGILKDAWRNHTMHAKGSYSDEQVIRIFENVKGFMQTLAERLHE